MAALTFDDVAPDMSSAPPPSIQDSPYLPMINHLEDSDGAARVQSKKLGRTITADDVISGDGAIGRYQIEPPTASTYGVSAAQLKDAAWNKYAGNRYLAELHEQFGDDPEAIAVGYEAGAPEARRWLAAKRNDAILGPRARAYVQGARAYQAAQGPLSFDQAAPGPLQFDDVAPKQKPQESSWWDVLVAKPAENFWPSVRMLGGSIEKMIGENPDIAASPEEIRAQQMAAAVTPAKDQQEQRERNAEMAAQGTKLYQSAAADIKANSPNLDPGSAKDYAYKVASGTVQMIPALVATTATRNPLIGAVMMGDQALAEKYGQARADGRSPGEAGMDAFFSGVTTGVMGNLKLGILMKPGGSFLAQTFKGAGSFGVISVLQEGLQLGYDRGLVTPDMTVSEAVTRIKDAGIIGTLQGALLGGGHAGLEKAIARMRATPAARQEEQQGARPNPPEAPAAKPQAKPDLLAQVGMRPTGTPPESATVPKPPIEPPPSIEAQRQSVEPARQVRAALPAMPDVTNGDVGIANKPIVPDTAVTASGREIPVTYALVEAHHLTPSQTPEGNINPAYPQELQPRDRTRLTSQAQISNIARNMNPRLLDQTYSAADGAPIVSPSGVVESGNGRTLAVQQAYAQNYPSAQAYREYLAAQGYPVENMTAPMLVRIRAGDMTPEERLAFVREANESGQLRYSATEQAMTDAARLPEGALDLFRGGDVQAAGNRDFVRSFLTAAVPTTEQGTMIGRNGELSQEAIRRIQSALFAKAYADPQLLGAIVESPDNNIRAIGGALTDAAPDWARMRARAGEARIPPELDQTRHLLEATRIVAQARQDGRNVAEYVNQPDIFTGEKIDPATEGWLRLMFRNPDFTGPVGRDRLAESIRFYAQEAQKVDGGPNLLGIKPLEPLEILGTAKERQYGTSPAGVAEGAPLPLGEGLRPLGGGGAGPGVEAPPTGGGAQAAAAGREGARPPGQITQGDFGPRANVKFAAGEPGVMNGLNGAFEIYRGLLGVPSGDRTRMLNTIASFVQARGQDTGHESLVIYDPDRVEWHAATQNAPANVAFSDHAITMLSRPDGRLISFHNHPTSNAPSTPDLVSVVQHPGHRELFVAAHDGHFYSVKLAAEIPDRMAAGATEGLRASQRAAGAAIFPAMQGEVNEGLNPHEASIIHGNIVNRALDRAGLTHYFTSRLIPHEFSDLVEEATNAAKAAVEPWTEWIKPAAVDRDAADRRSEPVRFGDRVAAVLGELGLAPGQRQQAPRPAAGTGRPGGQAVRPTQLRLLEEEGPYKSEPGAVDAKGKPLPQLIMPGMEGGARELAAAKEVAGKGKKTTAVTQKEAGPLFGPPKVDHPDLFSGFLKGESGAVPVPAQLQAAFDRGIENASANAMDLARDVQMLVSPMGAHDASVESRGTAKDYANLMRYAQDYGNRAIKAFGKNFTRDQLKKMWVAGDEENVARQTRQPTEGIGLSTLTPAERAATVEQQQDAQSVWNAMRQAGMVKGDSLPFWVPRMLVEIADTGAKRLSKADIEARSIPGLGGNVRTSTASLLRRKYMTTGETEAAASQRLGVNAEVVKDIRTLPLAVMRVRQALAGRQLINRIREIGQRTGEETVVEGAPPEGSNRGWFTMQHPSFFSWRPKFVTDAETGKTVAAVDQNGETVLEKVPLYVRSDFEGPLRAIMSEPSGRAYNAIMALKAKSMTAIMYSPIIHNAVEWGRALPALPGKVATFRIYFEGNAAKNNPETRQEAIMHGLVPIGGRAMGDQDITGMASPENIRAGRSWTAKLLGAVPNLFDPKAGQAVYRAIDAAGDFWHNTLLWDRVGDLQFGLYTNLRDHLIEQGMNPESAQWTAAHFANRYAGALPKEAMSSGAQKLANLLMFSRTYTLGNLGAMKDMITGLPRDVQAKIEQEGGVEELGKVRGVARRKAIAILATDIALFHLGNALLQSGISAISGRESWKNAFVDDYARRLNGMLHSASENPLQLLNPFWAMGKLTPQSENEYDRETGEPIQRVLVGYQKDGTAIYARNPAGKIGEEFEGWLTRPFDMAKRKLSPIAGATYETITNDAGYGRHVYDPNGTLTSKIGAIVSRYMEAQVPFDSLKSGYNLMRGKGTDLDALKTGGPIVGVTFRKGAPGGPVFGEMQYLKREHEAQISAAMPGIFEQIKGGDVQGARARMKELGFSPRLMAYYVRTTLNPQLRENTRTMHAILQGVSPEERERIERFRQLRGAQ